MISLKLITHMFLCLLPLTVIGQTLPMCDMENCEGYYSLKEHKVKKPAIDVTKTTVKIIEGAPTVNVLYAKRRWLTIYCYDGSSIDYNTGCYESITNTNPSCKEMSEWVKGDECPTGWECRPDGDCVGSDANIKCFDSNTIIKKKGPTSLKWEGTRYMKFPMHTCTSSWECNVFKVEVPTFVKALEDGSPAWVFYNKDNVEYSINDTMIVEGATNALGEKYCIEGPTHSPSMSIEEASCYSEDIKNIKCIITSNTEHEGLVIDISETGVGVLRNLWFEVVGQLLVTEKGTLIDINAGRIGAISKKPNILLDRQRSVNVETAHELAVSATILQLQSMYNLLSLTQEVDEIYNMILTLVKSQSLTDPSIVHKILKTKPFAVKWDNDEVFEKCKCIDDVFPHNSNCAGERKYNFGSYIKINDTSTCFHISDDTIEQLSLVDPPSLHVETIKYLPEETSSMDSAAWDALNDYRNGRIEGDRYSHSYENLNNRLQSFEESLGIGELKRYFLYATYAVSWISLVILVLTCRR